MGNDILAKKGTPVVANVGGVVTQRNGAVSGLAYFLAGDDGNRYFGAHLDSFGASGRVSMGTVIGTVGNTGDASGGPPHLHFEIHPGGSGYTNPYTTLEEVLLSPAATSSCAVGPVLAQHDRSEPSTTTAGTVRMPRASACSATSWSACRSWTTISWRGSICSRSCSMVC